MATHLEDAQGPFLHALPARVAENLFNHVNLANPMSDLNGGTIDSSTGRVINPGSFGLVTSTSSNPRIIQFAAKLHF